MCLGYGWKGPIGHGAAPSYHTGGKLERAGLACWVSLAQGDSSDPVCDGDSV